MAIFIYSIVHCTVCSERVIVIETAATRFPLEFLMKVFCVLAECGIIRGTC